MPTISMGRQSTDTSWPPPNPPDATEDARLSRLQKEAEAKKISEAIDRALSQEKDQRKRQSGVKLLLLGQAESGKSTVLKNFYLRFSPKTFQEEAELWRPIIHLNLVRSINFVLDVLSSSTERPTSPSPDSDGVKRIRFSLRPLKEVEDSLTKRISGSMHVPSVLEKEVGDTGRYHPQKASEVQIASGGTGWKNFLKRRQPSPGRTAAQKAEDESNRRILHACAEDMITLWEDDVVQATLAEKAISLKHQPGFFLEDIKRITDEKYLPTSHDVLRARVKTLGPEEHRIPMDLHNVEKQWVIYDVGGSRSQRAKWAQFFDDVTAIIFLAPISAFNQVLAEDSGVNRLADSFKLWKMICESKLLADVNLILFLNKMDILNSHLKSGMQFSRYVPNYRDKPNDVEHVSKYLLDVFTALHNQSTPKKRKIYPHLTTAVDTVSTSIVITEIQELLLVKALADTNIL